MITYGVKELPRSRTPRTFGCGRFQALTLVTLCSTWSWAYAQQPQWPTIYRRYSPPPTADRALFRTPEFQANWGLAIHGFDAAYALGATGQGVTIGQLDKPIWTGHPEFAGIEFGRLGEYPLAATPEIDFYSREITNHGEHVAGIMIARKDGMGMHGGGFGVTRFLAGYYDGVVKLNGKLLGQSILETGVSFINHSYGRDFRYYRIPINLDDEKMGYRGPNIDDIQRVQPTDHIVESSIGGVVNVSSAGNDRYYSDVRLELFRGISPGDGNRLGPYLASTNGMANDRWRRLEKGTVAVANLNRTGEIDYSSNICGITKYYCLSAAGTNVWSTVMTQNIPKEATPKDYAEIISKLQPSYQPMTGTSMAAPQVTAGLAVVKSRFPYLQNWQIRDTLLTTAKDLGAPGIDRVYGWGKMDIEAALGGPRMFFGLRRDYFDELLAFERAAAAKYDPVVAKANVFADRALALNIQILDNKKAANEAEKAGNATRAEELRQLNKMLISQEREARKRAYEHELTRNQPNDPRDTSEAAFEAVNWSVHIPGHVSTSCPSSACISDTWTNDINGPGGFTKTGAGMLRLTGHSTFFQDSFIAEGEVGIDGSIISSAQVYDGAVLSGIGSVGGIHARPGSIVAPGHPNSLISTLTVKTTSVGDGNAILEPGSFLAIEVDASGANDRLEVEKRASIAGSFLLLSKPGAERQPTGKELRELQGQRYTFLSAGEGIAGRFDKRFLPSYAFLSAVLTYWPNRVTASIEQTRRFAEAGETGNQRSSAQAIEALGAGNDLYEALIVSERLEEARRAFDATSGEVHASLEGSLLGEAFIMQNATMSRLRAAFGSPGAASSPVTVYGKNGPVAASADAPQPVVWGYGYGGWGSRDGDRNAARLTHTTGGFIIGADALADENWRLGLAGGYGKSQDKVNARASAAKTDSYTIAGYAGTRIGPLAFCFGATRAWHSIETNRSIVFSDFSDTATASYGARTLQAHGEVGYALNAGTVRFEPFANLAHVHLSVGGYREEARTSAGLIGGGSQSDVTYSTLGLRADTQLAFGGRAYGTLAWRHAFGDVTPTTIHAFASAQSFEITGTPIARNAALVESGLEFALAQSASFSVAYQGQLARSVHEHGVNAKLELRF